MENNYEEYIDLAQDLIFTDLNLKVIEVLKGIESIEDEYPDYEFSLESEISSNRSSLTISIKKK